MLWMFLAKDTLYLKDKKPIVLKPVETTVEEENFRHRFSINEFVYPTQISRGHFGGTAYFYQMIGGLLPSAGFSFSVRGLPPTSNRMYINGIPLLNMMLSSLAPLPINENLISSARIYRGDAPIEYDGFLGGVIDMSVEPVYDEAQVGVPTTYVFFKGLFGQYNNPAYVKVGDEPRWRTEDYSTAFIRNFLKGRIRLNVLYAHSWMDFRSRFITVRERNDSIIYEEKDSNFGNLSSLIGASLEVRNVLRAYYVRNEVNNTIFNTYGSLLRGKFGTLREMVGITSTWRYGGFEISYDRLNNSSAIINFWSKYIGISGFLRTEFKRDNLLFYLGGRLTFASLTSGPEKLSYSIKKVLPTFRLKVKYFTKENEAYRLTVGTAYQNTSSFFPMGNINIFPASYFSSYPYGGVLTLGRESLHRFVITETEVYMGLYKPHVFYNWGIEGGDISTEMLLRHSVNATVLSYGFDLTVTDRSKDNFRVSATVGRSRFIRGVGGASPWERRYALSLVLPYFSIILSDGIPSYGWFYRCDRWERSGAIYVCKEYHLEYTFKRTTPTILLSSGKEWRYRGFKVRAGVGNFLFFFNRLISTTKVDPTAVYLIYPVAYLYVVKQW